MCPSVHLSVNQFISVNWLGVGSWKNYGPNGFLSDVTKSDYNFCPADISAGNPCFRLAGGNVFSKNGPKMRGFGIIEVIMASLCYSNRPEILKGGGHVSPHCPSGSDTFLTCKLRKSTFFQEKIIFCHLVYLGTARGIEKLFLVLYWKIFYGVGCIHSLFYDVGYICSLFYNVGCTHILFYHARCTGSLFHSVGLGADGITAASALCKDGVTASEE